MLRTLWGVAIWTAAATGGATSVTLPFEIRDPKSRRVLVTGEEHVRTQDGAITKHTEYKAGNALLATEDASIDATRLVVKEYRFRDFETGEEATLAVKAGKADATYRKSKNRDVELEVIDWTRSSVHGKLLPELLLANWDQLHDGGGIEFDLYVPFRLDTLRFRAVKHRQPILISRDKKLVTIRIEPTNFLLRQLAPTIYFTFDEALPHRLVHYRGPSMVDIGGEKNKSVEIFFGPAA